MGSIPKKIKTNWDLTPLLASDTADVTQYRKAMTKATDAFVKKWRQRTDYLKDPKIATQALDDMEALEAMPENGHESFYFQLRAVQDESNAIVKARDKQSDDYLMGIINQLEFFWLNIGKIAPDLQMLFLQDKELAPYRHILEKTFNEAKHRLSEAEEKILALKSSVAHGNWAQMVENFLSRDEREIVQEDGSKVLATQETMMALTTSKDKKVRDTAGSVLDKLFADHSTLAEVELNSILANKKIDDELRGFSRPDESRHVSDDIDTEVVDAMLGAVEDRNHLPRKFYEFKAKLLGMPSLRYHERGLGYGAVDKDYSFEEAATLVHNVFAELDPEFASIFTMFLEQGRIDVYPNKGKRTGAFCAARYLTNPVYVMLNFTGKVRDVTTLAHEMGHAINDELIKKKQHSLNFDTPMATAEVASTFMEDFITERLAVGADDELKLKLMVDKLDNSISTIFRQVAVYRFEQELHRVFRKEGYVTVDVINTIFKKHMASYMGTASEGCENWWVYWAHIRYFFYVYSYASGLLISKSLQAKVRKNKAFIGEVKQFLSAGISRSPKDIFADMGIDITDKNFWQQGLDEVEQLLKDTEALAKKLGKIS